MSKDPSVFDEAPACLGNLIQLRSRGLTLAREPSAWGSVASALERLGIPLGSVRHPEVGDAWS